MKLAMTIVSTAFISSSAFSLPITAPKAPLNMRASNSAECVDFNGKWEGVCKQTVNGQTAENQVVLNITQLECDLIDFDGGEVFQLPGTVETNNTGAFFQEKTVIKTKWNDDKSELLTDVVSDHQGEQGAFKYSGNETVKTAAGKLHLDATFTIEFGGQSIEQVTSCSFDKKADQGDNGGEQ